MGALVEQQKRQHSSDDCFRTVDNRFFFFADRQLPVSVCLCANCSCANFAFYRNDDAAENSMLVLLEHFFQSVASSIMITIYS